MADIDLPKPDDEAIRQATGRLLDVGVAMAGFALRAEAPEDVEAVKRSLRRVVDVHPDPLVRAVAQTILDGVAGAVFEPEPE